MCRDCQKPVEDACFKLGSFAWHQKCFKCSVCEKDMRRDCGEARLDSRGGRLLCMAHSTSPLECPFVVVSQLQQYSFCLSVALKRVASLLNASR